MTMSRSNLETPYFMIDEKSLLRNLEVAKKLKKLSGIKLVLALKSFSTWGVFEIMRPYLDGTTSSSLFEARLGYENFGGETHAYSVGYNMEHVEKVACFCDKVIFNSQSQLAMYKPLVEGKVSIGLRLNPGLSYADQSLADPARRFSRLGVQQYDLNPEVVDNIDGVMIHANCENKDLNAFIHLLDTISERFGAHLDNLSWVSLGGGVFFTWPGYNVEGLAAALRRFSQKHSVQLYLEPGEAIITKAASLIVTVVDIVENEMKTAIVDASAEAHRLDTLIYNEPATIGGTTEGGQHQYIIGSCSCLAGDQFCEASFKEPLEVGQKIQILDSAGYTMVKLNWFNGLKMPSFYCERVNGKIQKLNEFTYDDFKRSLSLWSLS